MDYVDLYTRQHENSIHELNRVGTITNKEIYIKLHMMDIADFFLEKYRHFVMLANQIIPKPDDVEFPIWCSISKRNCLKPIDKELVYILRVPKEEVLYFDGGKWDYVLNNLYIPKDEEDEKAYFEEIKKLGVKDQFNFISGKYKGMFPHIDKKIIDSWPRIFEIDEWNDFVVQANLWQIKKEWVRHVLKPGDDIFDYD